VFSGIRGVFPMSVNRSTSLDPAGQPTAVGLPPRRPIKHDVPPLNTGDHLSRAEFERRYEAMPHVKKAELVEGIVYMPSPVYAPHGKNHATIMGWLFTYTVATPGVQLFDNTSLRLDTRNEVQPDGMLLMEAELGGRCRLSEDGFVEGSPELVVEVAASSAAYDLHSKFQAYQRNKVQEYLVLLTYEKRIAWHELTKGRYVPIQPDDNGILRSRVFPGLWLDADRLWADDLTGLLAALREGLASTQHAEFVTRYSSIVSNPTAIK
jgi:Uma2 family endonuclease